MKLDFPEFGEHGKTIVTVMVGANLAFISIMGYNTIQLAKFVSEFVARHVN